MIWLLLQYIIPLADPFLRIFVGPIKQITEEQNHINKKAKKHTVEPDSLSTKNTFICSISFSFFFFGQISGMRWRRVHSVGEVRRRCTGQQAGGSRWAKDQERCGHYRGRRKWTKTWFTVCAQKIFKLLKQTRMKWFNKFLSEDKSTFRIEEAMILWLTKMRVLL